MDSHLGQQENWLITGGLGYIGAHVARNFLSAGQNVVIIDNLSTGRLERLPTEAIFVEGDIRNSDIVREVCLKYAITGVVHLAAFKHARESRLNPFKYWANNVGAVMGLVEGIAGLGIKKVILSSSCSIYGNASDVNEQTPPNPQSPYAFTKFVSEEILAQCLNDMGIAYTALRFFNVIGCDSFPGAPDVSEECLVPVISNRIKSGLPVEILGINLQTPDGTCLRDYLDVRDIANAHIIVSREMNLSSFPKVINLSSGKATSVKQIVSSFESVIGNKIQVKGRDANPADPVAVWSQISTKLDNWGWTPQYDLHDSIASHCRINLQNHIK